MSSKGFSLLIIGLIFFVLPAVAAIKLKYEAIPLKIITREKDFQILFHELAGVYTVDKKQKNANEILGRLQKSLSARQSVSFQVEADESRILELLLPAP